MLSFHLYCAAIAILCNEKAKIAKDCDFQQEKRFVREHNGQRCRVAGRRCALQDRLRSNSCQPTMDDVRNAELTNFCRRCIQTKWNVRRAYAPHPYQPFPQSSSTSRSNHSSVCTLHTVMSVYLYVQFAAFWRTDDGDDAQE